MAFGELAGEASLARKHVKNAQREVEQDKRRAAELEAELKRLRRLGRDEGPN